VSRAIRAWFASLSRVAKAVVGAVIAAGAVATSIGAILALWPDPDEPPAVLDAEFSDITVDENIPVGEFKLRETELQGSAAGSVARSHVAAFTVGQQTATVTYTAVQETDTTETTGTDTTGTTDTDTTGTTDTDTTGTTDTTDDLQGLNDALNQARRNPNVEDIELPDACQSDPGGEECAIPLMATLGEKDVSPSEAADQLVKFFTEVRKHPLSTSRSEPLGVTVNYKLTVTGFRDRTVRVRWELHRPGGGELPHEWLRKQRPASWVGEADTDSVSPNLWIPLPVTSGRFFVRLIAEDENGSPLDRANTRKFQ
jgi:hypothetical protein